MRGPRNRLGRQRRRGKLWVPDSRVLVAGAVVPGAGAGGPGSLQLNGTDQYGTFDLGIATLNVDFTALFWFRPDSGAAAAPIVQFGATDYNIQAERVQLQIDRSPYFAQYTTSIRSELSHATPYANGTWGRIALRKTALGRHLFVDDTTKVLTPDPVGSAYATNSPTRPYQIGRVTSGGAGIAYAPMTFWKMAIDESAIADGDVQAALADPSLVDTWDHVWRPGTDGDNVTTPDIGSLGGAPITWVGSPTILPGEAWA